MQRLLTQWNCWLFRNKKRCAVGWASGFTNPDLLIVNILNNLQLFSSPAKVSFVKDWAPSLWKLQALGSDCPSFLKLSRGTLLFNKHFPVFALWGFFRQGNLRTHSPWILCACCCPMPSWKKKKFRWVKQWWTQRMTWRRSSSASRMEKHKWWERPCKIQSCNRLMSLQRWD